MTDFDRAALFGKLNTTGYQAIEAATVACRTRGHREVGLAHWFDQLLRLSDSDLHRIVRHAGMDHGQLAHDLNRALEGMPAGASSVSDLSADLEEMTAQAWMHASLGHGETRIRTGHLVAAAVGSHGLRRALGRISAEFCKVTSQWLSDEWSRVLAGSPESSHAAAGTTASGPAVLTGHAALQRYTVDLTALARKGDVDPVVGRDKEIRQIVDVLMRRRQNNPLLVGEAGVGKTAVAEGLALRIVQGDVPPSLRDVELRSLDLGLLQAGAGAKGEFEERLRQVMDEVQASERPVVLFIDEVHTLVGAGGTAGTGDAANLLKPALARGSLRTVGATTWSEYKRYIEKDPALTRRFQPVKIDEPDEETAVHMLRAMAGAMERHHGVQVLDEAIRAAVKLSHRYVPARQLPDKAVSLLDTACARVAISQHAVPAAIGDLRHGLSAMEDERNIVARDVGMGLERADRLVRIDQGIHVNEQVLAGREQAWLDELQVVGSLLDAGERVRGRNDEASRDAFELSRHRLASLQGEQAMVHPWVDDMVVGSVVSDWTGIPLGRMLRSEMETVLDLPAALERRVIGQPHALETIARRMRTSRAGLDDPARPVGVFLLAGMSGTGKTETALALAEALYGGEQNLVTLNMSEFQEPHSVSTIKGAPPGYVGYGEGGVLTEAVRRRPHAVILLDEIEKAHPDVHELFYQVFDRGYMEDGEGRSVDFRNTLILLTTNVGTSRVSSLCREDEAWPSAEMLAESIREPLREVFSAAFLGRMVVIPYLPLPISALERIVRMQLERIRQRVADRYGASMTCTEEAVGAIVDRCRQGESGARAIMGVLTHGVLPDISRRFIEAVMEARTVTRLTMDAVGDQFTYELH